MVEPVETPIIVWDTSSLQVDDPSRAGGWARPDPRLESVGHEPNVAERVAQLLWSWRSTWRRRSFERQHCHGPMETTRRMGSSVGAATAALGKVDPIDWTTPASTGRLHLEPFRFAQGEPGRPWVADAVLHARRARRLDVSVAIYTYGRDRCGIEIRPHYRRPWSQRRLRRCIGSTHGAADRLRAVILAAGLDDVIA